MNLCNQSERPTKKLTELRSSSHAPKTTHNTRINPIKHTIISMLPYFPSNKNNEWIKQFIWFLINSSYCLGPPTRETVSIFTWRNRDQRETVRHKHLSMAPSAQEGEERSLLPVLVRHSCRAACTTHGSRAVAGGTRAHDNHQCGQMEIQSVAKWVATSQTACWRSVRVPCRIFFPTFSLFNLKHLVILVHRRYTNDTKWYLYAV
jgi:hypothetical protein